MEDKNLITKTDSEIDKEERVVKEASEITKAIREELNVMPYISASSCVPIGAVVPTKLSYETVEALNTFIGNGIDTSEFVREKLGYDSRLSVCSAFASEQVDAIALAIKQIENGKGFILGDMAGIGKGRVVAGICRYAKQSGKIPVFMTIGSTLFSDIYRDFYDIGGFKNSPPMSNYDGLPSPFIFNEDGVVQRQDGEEMVTLFEPNKTKVTVEFCLKSKGVLPKNTDIVLLTYSQLSKDMEKKENINAIAKYEFLKSIAPKSIFVLDESHKGAGDGNIGVNIYNLLSLVSGVMFSSATYSKVPKSMMLYIPKTDISDSKIRPNTIVDAVAENGEAIQEYIASLLVKSGQMIRRERTFDKCRISYEYPPKSEKPKYYELYDNVMSLYNEIDAFSKSSLYSDARKEAIERFAKENKVQLVPKDDYKVPNKPDAKSEWEERNKNKYFYSYPTTNIIKNRFQWIENLLFSIKAEYVTNKVIGLLQNREDVEYTEGDKTRMVNTNYKPIIAVRNTAEASLVSLGYKVGNILTAEQNDYAKTLINIAKSLVQAQIIFSPINTSKKDIVIENAKIEDSDFSDKGVRYNEILDKMSNATSGLPLSPIDYMINKIEETKRASWDGEYSNSNTYKVEEVTKRSVAIKKTKDGKFEIQRIKKETATDKVSRFNSGQSDVIILNTAGSTGLSLHSKFDFTDTRPRVLVIHQVELDVATEVQKRGRINRTGQINNPAYTYIVSIIPSEIRKLLMLRKKLRSLDATTTGNVKQSAKASEILDADGNMIEDMTNKYGYQALQEFFNDADGIKYSTLVVDGGWWNSKGSSPEELFEMFLREVEKLPCGKADTESESSQRANQEDFYNKMNDYYIKLKTRLIKADEWDLETSTEDLNASTLNKKKLFEGNNKNEFTKSVYIEDKFVTPKGKPYTKEELYDVMVELSLGKDFNKFHNDIILDYELYTNNKLEDYKQSFGDADVSNAKTKEEKETIRQEHKELVDSALSELSFKLNKTKQFILYFSPDKAIQMPIDTELLYDGEKDKNGNRKGIPYYVGIVVGFKFLSKSDNKFSPMNIELRLASTSKIKPILNITLTKQYEPILNWIIGGRLHARELAEVREWIIKGDNERDKMRVMTGEIFKAFEVTEDIFSSDQNYKRKKRLIKYTTSAGTIETGVKLFQNRFVSLTNTETPVFATMNSEQFIGKLNSLPKDDESQYLFLPSKNEMFNRVGDVFYLNLCTGIHTKGWRGQDRKNVNKVYLSQYAKTEITDAITNATGIQISMTRKSLTMFSKGSDEYIYNMSFISFLITKNNLQKALDYFSDTFGVLMEIQGEQEFIIREMPDTYIPDEEIKSEEGEYQYFPIAKFNESVTPPNYIRNSYKPTEENQYGIITLKFPLSVVQSNLFKVVPANITESDAVQNILKAINEDNTRLEYINKVKEFGDDYIGIALITQEIIGVPPKYAIGLVDNYYAGKVISENINNPTPEKESKKVVTAMKKESDKEKISLDWNTAQDFLIQMKSL
jgi:hypothetical protein